MSLPSVAQSLLDAYGSALTFTRSTSTSFDPVAGVEVAGSDLKYTGKVISSRYDIKNIDSAMIKMDDKKLSIYSATKTPTNGDTVEIDDNDYQILSVQHITVKGSASYYVAQARQ